MAVPTRTGEPEVHSSLPSQEPCCQAVKLSGCQSVYRTDKKKTPRGAVRVWRRVHLSEEKRAGGRPNRNWPAAIEDLLER